MPVSLRGYQTEFRDAIRSEMAQHRRVLGVSPTGSGKTVTFASIAEGASIKGKLVTIEAHRIEIVNQISAALDQLGVRHGRIQTGHSPTSDNIQVGMIQTLAKRLDLYREPDLIIMDEAHHGVAGTWMKVSGAWLRSRLLGVTATPQRADGKGLGDAFDAMVLGPRVAWLIEEGYLSDYDYFAPPVVADIAALRAKGKDFNADEAAAQMDKAVVTGDAVAHYLTHLKGRSAVIFCCNVSHSEHVARQFVMAGIKAVSVDGTTDPDVRARYITGLGSGRIEALVSCNIISEGTDIPAVAGAILLRPTQSLAMFLQQIGRVLRPIYAAGYDLSTRLGRLAAIAAGPKPRAVILDHVGNAGVRGHGMPDDDRVWSLTSKAKREEDTIDISQCKACYRTFNATQPGWKREHEACDGQPSCIFGVAETAARAELEVVVGELKRVEREAKIKADWIRTNPLSEILTGRETASELAEIAKIKNYHPKWVQHRLMQTGRSSEARRA